MAIKKGLSCVRGSWALPNSAQRLWPSTCFADGVFQFREPTSCSHLSSLPPQLPSFFRNIVERLLVKMMAPRSIADRTWMRIAIPYMICAYPSLWGFCEVGRHRHSVVWACYGLSFGFNISVFFISRVEDSIYGPQTPVELGLLTNCLFPLVDAGLSLALRHSHSKLICQPWQRRYPAIHLLIIVPIFFITTGLMVVVTGIRDFRLWLIWGELSLIDVYVPLMTVFGSGLTVFSGTLQLLALAILIFHPEFRSSERYEPIYEWVGLSASEFEAPNHHHTNHSNGLLASRFSIHESDALLPTGGDFMTRNIQQNEGAEAAQVRDNYQPEMDFHSSLKSWRALSWIKPTYVPLINLLVSVVTVWDMVIGCMHLIVAFEMRSSPEKLVHFPRWVISESSTQPHLSCGA